MENNIYDMNNVSKEVIRKNAKYEKAAGEFLKEYDNRLANEIKAKEEKALNEAMSGARFSKASAYARSKARVEALKEEIRYTNDSSVVAMTEMVSEVVERALLLDEEDFERLHPNYRQDIRDTVRGLLENAEVENEISNPDTLAIMEYIARTLPGTREGVSLTESELSNYVASKIDENIEKSINKLSGNVSNRVASLMEKEQKKIQKIEEEVQAATGEVPEEEIPVDENGNPIDPNAMPQEEVPVDENGNPIDPNAPVEAQPQEQPAGLCGNNGCQPKKQIQMLPDGTMNINIFEELDRYDECESLLESSNLLEKNEEQKMLSKSINKNEAKGTAAGAATLGAAGAVGGAIGVGGAASAGIAGSLGSASAAIGLAGAGPIGSLFLGGVGAIIGALIGKGIAHIGHDRKLLKLTKLAERDPECKKILNELKPAIARGDKEKCKELKKAFAARLKYLKAVNPEVLKEGFVHETPRCGLIESLAVNEATNMLKEGKEYNPDLALANALMTVTITETLDEMGIVLVDDNKYKVITEAAGGVYNPKRPVILNDAFKMNKTAKKVNSTVLNEGVICAQEAPRLNKYTSDDFAERIRQRKLLKEQQAQSNTLHD